jgi:hypothetical protein
MICLFSLTPTATVSLAPTPSALDIYKKISVSRHQLAPSEPGCYCVADLSVSPAPSIAVCPGKTSVSLVQAGGVFLIKISFPDPGWCCILDKISVSLTSTASVSLLKCLYSWPRLLQWAPWRTRWATTLAQSTTVRITAPTGAVTPRYRKLCSNSKFHMILVG